MKKVLSILLTLCIMGSLLAAFPASADELVDGRFTETHKITVEVFDRGLDGGRSPAENNFYTQYIKDGMLAQHNVEVTFVPVSRWSEVEQIANRLAGGTAPDICYTFSYPTIQTYAGMGAVLDLSQILSDYKDVLPNLWNTVGEDYLYWDQDPTTGALYNIESKVTSSIRVTTFVRGDWLDKLGLAAPTTNAEFEAMLYAFKENAELLLGADADKIIPFSMSSDVMYRTEHIMASFAPNALTSRERFAFEFDDRRFAYPGVKEGARKINEWYNAGLMWNDFPLYLMGDSVEDNLLKAGYVGSFIHNADYPYRNGADSITASMQKLVGPEARFIPVNAFQDDAGVCKKFLNAPLDRKIFMPSTNKDPLASLLYLDFIADPANRFFLSVGEEGVTHEVMEDGAIKTIITTGEKIMNSPSNVDYVITGGGLGLSDDLVLKTYALSYPGCNTEDVIKAYQYSTFDGQVMQNYNVGTIEAENGIIVALGEKRDIILAQAITASPDKFDAVWDAGYAEYLEMGAKAIMEERLAALEKFYPIEAN